MMAYEQSLKLFERWCRDEMGIFTVDKVTENVFADTSSSSRSVENTLFTELTSKRKPTIQSGGGTTENPSAPPRSTTTFVISVCSSTGWSETMLSSEIP